MLTQLELLGTSTSMVRDEDSSMSGSPLDGLAEYAIEQTGFEYIDTSLSNDAYYNVSQQQQQHQNFQQSMADTLNSSPSICDVPPGENMLIYDQENIGGFTTDDIKFIETMKPYENGLASVDTEMKFEDDIQKYEQFAEDLYDSGLGDQSYDDRLSSSGKTEIKFEDEEFYDSGLGDHTVQDDDCGLQSLYNTLDSEQLDSTPVETKSNLWNQGVSNSNNKGKIGPLQKRALESIFTVTDKPSRGLVLHIASELGLHHLTVKNFFSNGRRRLRRAAARLNDPERTRRENERRKEKRLAAQASAANIKLAGKGGRGLCGIPKTPSPRSLPPDSPPPKASSVVSPERKALMEKLADKVQRSVAQRSLAADLENPPCSTSQQSLHTSHPPTQATHQTYTLNHNPQLPTNAPLPPIQPMYTNSAIAQTDLLTQDLLGQDTQELLAHAPPNLMTPPHHEFLQPSPACSSLLQSSTDPWNLL